MGDFEGVALREVCWRNPTVIVASVTMTCTRNLQIKKENADISAFSQSCPYATVTMTLNNFLIPLLHSSQVFFIYFPVVSCELIIGDTVTLRLKYNEQLINESLDG